MLSNSMGNGLRPVECRRDFGCLLEAIEVSTYGKAYRYQFMGRFISSHRLVLLSHIHIPEAPGMGTYFPISTYLDSQRWIPHIP